MLRFDDFDAWGDTVSGANLRLVCDAIDTGVWTIGMTTLGPVTLQVASEGGGNLCYGGNTHGGTLLFVPLSHAAAHVVNGVPLDDDSLFLIPRGSDFRIHVRRKSHAWCSLALPDDADSSAGTRAGSRKVACPAGSLARLRHVVGGIATTLLDRPGQSAAHLAAGRDLEAAARDCLDVPPARVSTVGRPRVDRDRTIEEVMHLLDTLPIVPTAAEVAERTGVTPRTLLRIFQENFGVPPKRYLMLRELHAVRRRLQQATEPASVSDTLVQHGIWEFGRFASRYRRHFGELPSETVHRRAPT